MKKNELRQKRRDFLKVLAVLPLSVLFPVSAQAGMDDVDTAFADFWWQRYRENHKEVPRTLNRQCEQALQKIAAPVMASSTRKNLEWKIGLLAGDTVNAFTCGGGVIFIYEGLIALCESEAELASVIAHEVGHIEYRHAIRRHFAERLFAEYGMDMNWDKKRVEKYFDAMQYDAVADKIVYKSYKRLWEHQADAHIIKAFREIGYSLKHSYKIFEKFMKVFGNGNPGLCIYDSHPFNMERIARLKNLSKAYSKKKGRSDSEAFKYLKTKIN
ncbi:MAG: M48 family metallopeptidase [Desulfobacteraceae bacterium]|jgi:predicted Zn-dependent protease